MATPRDTISNAIRQAAAQGRPAVVGFMTAGFPDKAGFRASLTAIASTADVVEIGIPFTDPMADGMTIQRASRASLAGGFTLPWLLAELEAMQPRPQAPLLLMSYLNPLLAYGLDKLPGAAARAGVAGFIIPDLPYEESAEMRTALDSHGLALVQMVTPVTPPERLKLLCEASQGFVYAVTMTGTTGKNVAVPETGAPMALRMPAGTTNFESAQLWQYLELRRGVRYDVSCRMRWDDFAPDTAAPIVNYGIYHEASRTWYGPVD